MAEKLKPYDPKARCPKCGGMLVSTQYVEDGCAQTWQIGDNKCCAVGEHLHRTCQNCHYRWPEACTTEASDD